MVDYEKFEINLKEDCIKSIDEYTSSIGKNSSQILDHFSKCNDCKILFENINFAKKYCQTFLNSEEQEFILRIQNKLIQKLDNNYSFQGKNRFLDSIKLFKFLKKSFLVCITLFILVCLLYKLHNMLSKHINSQNIEYFSPKTQDLHTNIGIKKFKEFSRGDMDLKFYINFSSKAFDKDTGNNNIVLTLNIDDKILISKRNNNFNKAIVLHSLENSSIVSITFATESSCVIDILYGKCKISLTEIDRVKNSELNKNLISNKNQSQKLNYQKDKNSIIPFNSNVNNEIELHRGCRIIIDAITLKFELLQTQQLENAIHILVPTREGEAIEKR